MIDFKRVMIFIDLSIQFFFAEKRFAFALKQNFYFMMKLILKKLSKLYSVLFNKSEYNIRHYSSNELKFIKRKNTLQKLD